MEVRWSDVTFSGEDVYINNEFYGTEDEFYAAILAGSLYMVGL